jgi:hypothetical protein
MFRDCPARADIDRLTVMAASVRPLVANKFGGTSEYMLKRRLVALTYSHAKNNAYLIGIKQLL